MELISKKTRYEFREFLVGWTLREIEMEFDAADIPCCTDYDPTISGARRSRVEQYYKSLDFTDWKDVRKLLKVYENILSTISERYPKIVAHLCKWLKKDRFEYRDGKIVPIVGIPALAQTKAIAIELDADYMLQLVKRMDESVESDPSLAIGSAKELVETCCKTILAERGKTVTDDLDLTKLVKATLKELKLLPEDIPEKAKGMETIRRLLSNLSTVVQGLAEIRNLYGSGHGKEGRSRGLKPRHAKLTVNAAATLAVFMFETHRETLCTQH